MSRFRLLSDAQWDLIADLLPRPTGKKRRPFSDARTMVEGIVYRYRTGIAWRDLPLVIAVTPGQSGDSPMLIPLLQQLRIARTVGRPRTRPDRVRGDKAYSSRAIRQHLRDRGIQSVIPQPSDQIGHRVRRGSRDGRPVTYDRDDYKNRNVIERRFATLKQWRGPATRYDKLATVYRSAAVLSAIIAWTRHLGDTP